MNMYQKRKEKRENNSEEKVISSTGINWYKPTLINFQANLYFIRLFILFLFTFSNIKIVKEFKKKVIPTYINFNFF